MLTKKKNMDFFFVLLLCFREYLIQGSISLTVFPNNTCSSKEEFQGEKHLGNPG